MKSNYYVPSNKFSGTGLAVLFLSTVALGTVVAVVYLALIRLIPFVYINVILAGLYGGLIGWVGAKICDKFKLRNPSLVFTVTLFATLIFTYLKQVIYISNLFEVQFADIISNPDVFGEAIKIVNEKGTWSVGRYSSTNSGNVTGIFLWIVWIAEAVFINGMAIFFAVDQAKMPFIERENDWAKTVETACFVEHFSIKHSKHEIENNRKALLNSPRIYDVNGKNFVKITMQCSEDYSENYLNIEEMVLAKNKKNYTTVATIKNLAVDKDFITTLFLLHAADENLVKQGLAKLGREVEFSENAQASSSENTQTNENENSFVNNIEQPVSFEEFSNQNKDQILEARNQTQNFIKIPTE